MTSSLPLWPPPPPLYVTLCLHLCCHSIHLCYHCPKVSPAPQHGSEKSERNHDFRFKRRVLPSNQPRRTLNILWTCTLASQRPKNMGSFYREELFCSWEAVNVREDWLSKEPGLYICIYKMKNFWTCVTGALHYVNIESELKCCWMESPSHRLTLSTADSDIFHFAYLQPYWYPAGTKWPCPKCCSVHIVAFPLPQGRICVLVPPLTKCKEIMLIGWGKVG